MRLRVAPKAAFESRKVKIRVHLLMHNTISSADDPQLVPCAAWGWAEFATCELHAFRVRELERFTNSSLPVFWQGVLH